MNTSADSSRSSEKPAPNGLLFQSIFALAPIVASVILVWLPTQPDAPRWAYLLPIVLLLILVVSAVRPVIREMVARFQLRRKQQRAMSLYKPALVSILSKLIRYTSSSVGDAPAQVLNEINLKDEFGRVSYASEADHFRTLATWGGYVLNNLRGSKEPFEVAAREALEFIRIYLQHIENTGRRLDQQTILAKEASSKWSRVIAEWNEAINRLNHLSMQLASIVVEIGEIVGADYTNEYFPTLPHLSENSGPLNR